MVLLLLMELLLFHGTIITNSSGFLFSEKYLPLSDAPNALNIHS